VTLFRDDRAAILSRAQAVEVLVHECFPYEAAEEGTGAARAQASALLSRWVTEGLVHRHQAGDSRFDPVLLTDFLLRDRAYREHLVPNGRRTVLAMAGVPTPPIAFDPRPRTFEVEFRRRVSVEAAPGPLRVHLPAPLEDETQRTLRVTLHAPPAAKTRLGPGRLEVQLQPPPQGGQVSLSATILFEARAQDPSVVHAPPEPYDEVYLRPVEGLVRITPAVRSIAHDWGGRDPRPRAILESLWDMALRHLRPAHIHYDALDPTDPCASVLDGGGACDCVTGSAILVAALRARGVPARLVSGYSLYDIAPSPHTWFEARLDDGVWAPFDLSSWNLCAGDFADVAWSRYFFARLDPRMRTQRLPRVFTGYPGVQLPRAWAMFQRFEDGFDTISFLSRESGAELYSDSVRTREILPRLDEQGGACDIES
jgi:transglutaminase-like putative cysteine protease